MSLRLEIYDDFIQSTLNIAKLSSYLHGPHQFVYHHLKYNNYERSGQTEEILIHSYKILNISTLWIV